MPVAGRRSLAAVATGMLALVLLVTGCAGTAADGSPDGTNAAAAASPDPLSAGGMQDPRPRAAPDVAGAPMGISIPAIGVESALESLGIDGGGRLDAPVDYDTAGWYADGVVPGAVGPAIIAGHVDSPTAPAVFARIAELARGDEVFVTMSDGSVLGFAVTGISQSPKSEFPTSDVYSNVPVPELRLITCAGDFDSSAGHYTDNLVVFAALQG
ncbi:class F sortase [Microbacterium sp.]|uniref:class F sortase n=1 Tax=Microbacterium sp. TaxID=51671 RepID=UPI002E378F03|nr:class F sortase [Microbacterium sp.]HEX5728799.1 class F sortase [Microbacterium sp.]